MIHEREKRFDAIPAAACTLVSGEFELGDNGENAKSAPLKMVARSGQPIEHWFWGRVVHDLAGMHMHKSRLAVDYVHDDKEIVGYLNHFSGESGDLVASGALVPFKDTDRATEIIFKMGQGVPYESSINFGGDGIKVQELAEGEVTEVNGYTFEGPGCVVREWPLRGVAVCPYGADMNTESASAFSDNQKVFSASVVTEPEATTKEGAKMIEASNVEVEATVEAPEVELDQDQAEPVEAEATEEDTKDEEPEVESVEEEKPAEELTEEPAEKPAIDASEFKQAVDEFGADIAAAAFTDGGGYEDARELHFDALAAENDKLRKENAGLKENSNGTPAPVAEAKPEAGSIFKTGK